MRQLNFIIEGLIVKKDPSCDFSGLIPGTEGYLQAGFSFSPEWDNCIIVAEFRCGTIECPPQILKDNSTCVIPAEALQRNTFSIRLIGKHKNYRLTTNKIVVRQNGGRV